MKPCRRAGDSLEQHDGRARGERIARRGGGGAVDLRSPRSQKPADGSLQPRGKMATDILYYLFNVMNFILQYIIAL